jgi:hypothetical protein
MVNWNIEGGSVFLIMFRTRHALPLVKTRFSCPRIGRGEGRGWLRKMYCSWLQTRPIHELERLTHRTRQRIICAHEQSTRMFNSWKQTRLQTVSIRDDITVAKVLEPASAMAIKRPQVIHSRDLSTPANLPKIPTIRKPKLARNRSRHRSDQPTTWPASFPNRIQAIPYYEHV